MKNNNFNFILLISLAKWSLASLVLVLALSGCGLVSCMGGQGSNCDFGAKVTPNIYSMSIPILPSIESAANQQFITKTVYVDSRSSNWTDTGIILTGNEKVTIQVVPTSVSPATQNNPYPSIANGTINTCYLADNWDFSEGGAPVYSQKSPLAQPNVYYYPGPVQILALLDPSASSITALNSDLSMPNVFCNDGWFTFCPSEFNTNCTLTCSAQNGQGLETNFITDTGSTSRASCPYNYLGSSAGSINCANYSQANVLSLSWLFNDNAVILKTPDAKSLCAQINIPYQQFPATSFPFTKFFVDTCAPGGSTCAVLYDDPNTQHKRYNLYHVTTGCYGVNGRMDTQPPGGNANVGQLQYFISPSTPPGPSGNSNFPSQIGTFIDPTKTDDAGIVSTTFNASAGNLYLQVYDCISSSNIPDPADCAINNNPVNHKPSCYADNIGQYEVQITTPKPKSQTFLDIVTTDVINAITKQNAAVSGQMFGDIVAPGSFFRNIVNAALVLYVIVYGISFVSGIVMVTQKDAIIRVLKIGAVLALIGNESASLFSSLYYAFQNGLPYLVSIAGGGDGQPSDLFAFADVTMTYLTSTGVWVRILVFMLMFPIGWFLWTILCYAVISYAIVIIEAFIAYLVAITGIALFIALAPLFIILILFNLTRPIFNHWIKLLAGFVIQPVLLFSCIGVVNTLVLTALNNILQEASYRCLVPIYFNINIVDIDIVCFAAFIPNPLDIFELLTLSLILLILVDVLKKMPQFVQDAGMFLSGYGASVITQTAANIRTGVLKSATEFVGMDKTSVGRREMTKQRALRAANVANRPGGGGGGGGGGP